ncbi:MAG: hypothetical protein ACYDDF_05400 [Thermoplasmatota archaeon]
MNTVAIDGGPFHFYEALRADASALCGARPEWREESVFLFSHARTSRQVSFVFRGGRFWNPQSVADRPATRDQICHECRAALHALRERPTAGARA